MPLSLDVIKAAVQRLQGVLKQAPQPAPSYNPSGNPPLIPGHHNPSGYFGAAVIWASSISAYPYGNIPLDDPVDPSDDQVVITPEEELEFKLLREFRDKLVALDIGEEELNLLAEIKLRKLTLQDILTYISLRDKL